MLRCRCRHPGNIWLPDWEKLEAVALWLCGNWHWEYVKMLAIEIKRPLQLELSS